MRYKFRKKIIYQIIKIIKSDYRLAKARANHYKRYPKSETILMNEVPQECLSVSGPSYGELNIITFGSEAKFYIGNYVSIAQHVTFLLDVEHHINHVSTYPFKVKILQIEQSESFSKGDIIVQDDVWIGYGATILSGVHIAQGAVVAAGAVVTKDVEPYSIVGGVPAKIIKYRFDPPIIDFLLTLDYSKLDKRMIKEHIDDLYKDIHDMDLEEIKKLYEWFPKNQRNEI